MLQRKDITLVHPYIIVAVTLVRIFLGRLLKPGTLGAGRPEAEHVAQNLDGEWFPIPAVG